jgi:hypothetical protein
VAALVEDGRKLLHGVGALPNVMTERSENHEKNGAAHVGPNPPPVLEVITPLVRSPSCSFVLYDLLQFGFEP